MTGGQPMGRAARRADGSPNQLHAEGVKAHHGGQRRAGTNIPTGGRPSRRAPPCIIATNSTRVQRDMREIPGVTAIIYDPDLRGREAAAAQRAASIPDPPKRRGHQRGRVRGLRRLRRGNPTACP